MRMLQNNEVKFLIITNDKNNTATAHKTIAFT